MLVHTFYWTLIAAIVGWIVNEFNDTNGVFEPNHFDVPVLKLTGNLAPKLSFDPSKIERILDGQIKGPESFVLDGDTIYTGTADGYMVKIVKGHIVQKFPIIDRDYCFRTRCARPLGIRRWAGETFVFADAQLGIYVVDFRTETFRQVISSKQVVDNYPFMFADDFDFISNETIVFSDLSAKCGEDRFALCFLEHVPDGRLITLNLNTGKYELFAGNMYGTNGVQKHHDGVSLLVNEMQKFSVMRYYFAGPKKGQSEVFASGIPGILDNIRVSSKGNTYWVTCFAGVDENAMPLGLRTGQHPWIRKILGYLPERFRLHYWAYGATASRVVELDGDGRVLRSIHDLHLQVSPMTEVQDDGKHLYIGSYVRHNLIKVPLP